MLLELTIENIKRWGYEDAVYFREQDEELLLHKPQYIAILADLAADINCPKQSYCAAILEYYCQQLFLYRKEKELEQVYHQTQKIITNTVWLEDWKKGFLFAYQLFVHPQEISKEACGKLAQYLTIGTYCQRKLEKKRTLENGIIEYLASTETFRLYLYINPQTSIWELRANSPLVFE